MRILFAILALVICAVPGSSSRAQSHEEWVCGCRSGTKIASDSLSDGFTGAQTVQSFTNAAAGTMNGVTVTGGPFGSTSPSVRHWTLIIYDSAGTCAVGSELQQTYFLQPTSQVSAGTDPVDGFPLFTYTFATNFAYAANQVYWCCVLLTTTTTAPDWGVQLVSTPVPPCAAQFKGSHWGYPSWVAESAVTEIMGVNMQFEFSPVAAKPTTWGAIRSLYR
jgi:hypothetical protein